MPAQSTATQTRATSWGVPVSVLLAYAVIFGACWVYFKTTGPVDQPVTQLVVPSQETPDVETPNHQESLKQAVVDRETEDTDELSHELVAATSPATFADPTPTESSLTDPAPADPTLADASIDNPAQLLPLDEINHFRELQSQLDAMSVATFSELEVYLTTFENTSDRDGYAMAVHRAGYERLAELDFDATLDKILVSIDNPQEGSVYWDEQALSVLAEQQPDYVASSLSLVAGVFSSYAFSEALTGLSVELEPGAAAQQALEQLQLSGGDSRQDQQLTTALNAWVLQDPDAALAFVETQFDDEDQRQSLTADLLAQWLEHDPIGATPTIEATLNAGLAVNPDAYIELVDVYLTEQANSDPESALRWLQSQDSQYLRETAVDGVLQPWLLQDQDAALDYLAGLDEQTVTEILPQAISAVAVSLSGNSSSLDQALVWTEQLPDTLRNTSRLHLVGSWVSENPQQSVDWLVQQAASGLSDDLVLPAAKVLALQDAEAAIRLHANLTGDMQLAYTDSVVNSLARHGETRALQWINNQPDPLVASRGQSIMDVLF